MRMNPEECCKLYSAIRAHFTTERYDFIRYNGSIRMSDFSKRKDRYMFKKLVRNVPKKDMKMYIVSAFAHRDWTSSFWAGDLFNDSPFINYTKFFDSGTNMYQKELNSLSLQSKTVFSVKEGEEPLIVQKYMSGDLSIESLTILLHVLKSYDYYDQKLKDDFIWTNVRLLTTKYHSFLDYDRQEFLTKTKEILS